jgi:TonB family protein
MKKLLVVIFSFLFTAQISAQQIKLLAPKPFGGYNALISKIVYDEELVKKRVEGNVVVRFSVNEKGEVEFCKIVKSLNPGLDKSVINAVRTTVFLPGIKDGNKTTMQVDLPLLFKDRNVSIDRSAMMLPPPVPKN